MQIQHITSKVLLYKDSHQKAVAELLRDSIPALEAERLQRALSAFKEADKAQILLAFNPNNRDEVVAIGLVGPSMHDFGHWGLNIPVIKNGYESSKIVADLVDQLILYVEKNRDPNHDYLCMAIGTKFPDLVKKHDFKVVHSHKNANNQEIYWMLKVKAKADVAYSQINFSNPRVQPKAYPNVRVLLTASEIDQAAEIVSNEWGEQQASSFRQEFEELQKMPGSAVYGLIEDNRVQAVGAIIKALYHDEAWSRAWIVVNKELRGQGIAEKLIQGLLFHAHSQHSEFSSGPIVMEGFSYIPGYYEKYGNQPVAQVKIETPQGVPTWTMLVAECNQ